MEADMPSVLSRITMPVVVVQGDVDTAVPVANTQKWTAAMKDMKITHKYDEIPGGDHGSMIDAGIPGIFAFFNADTKSTSD